MSADPIEVVARAVRRLFVPGDGEVVLGWLKRSCFHDVPSYTIGTEGMQGALQTAFNEGRRQVLLDILEMMREPEKQAPKQAPYEPEG